MGELQESLATRVLDHSRLVEEDLVVVEEYRRAAKEVEEEREVGERLVGEVGRIRALLGRLDPLVRGLRESRGEERERRGGRRGDEVEGRRGKGGEVQECTTCHSHGDQHLLARCDTCHFHYHLACLNPPLAR